MDVSRNTHPYVILDCTAGDIETNKQAAEIIRTRHWVCCSIARRIIIMIQNATAMIIITNVVGECLYIVGECFQMTIIRITH